MDPMSGVTHRTHKSSQVVPGKGFTPKLSLDGVGFSVPSVAHQVHADILRWKLEAPGVLRPGDDLFQDSAPDGVKILEDPSHEALKEVARFGFLQVLVEASQGRFVCYHHSPPSF